MARNRYLRRRRSARFDGREPDPEQGNVIGSLLLVVCKPLRHDFSEDSSLPMEVHLVIRVVPPQQRIVAKGLHRRAA
ncbi:MAG: hypothetical protein P8I25_09435 [Ilumatobacter sp.]|nr:hypothetical protein [Ilumatobacter sp.]